MNELLSFIPPGEWVLDLGCAQGSFPSCATQGSVLRLDREVARPAPHAAGCWIQADSSSLPFRDHVFAAIIANHSMEHFDQLTVTLGEIGRVGKPAGALFVSVPDASTFTDRLYRWLARGGGHVNSFHTPEQVVRLIEDNTPYRHLATRTLCSSLSFLHQAHDHGSRPRKLVILGGGHAWTLLAYTWISRWLDRVIGLRLSVYGWALYFGTVGQRIDTSTWVNVCIRCGSGAPASRLLETGRVRRTWLGPRVFDCPDCGTANTFSPDYEVS